VAAVVPVVAHRRAMVRWRRARGHQAGYRRRRRLRVARERAGGEHREAEARRGHGDEGDVAGAAQPGAGSVAHADSL
jgi:hypothetical protein